MGVAAALRTSGLPEVLATLEAHHGKQQVTWPTDPWEFLVWWHCGYPASDVTCAKGWSALLAVSVIDPEAILAAGPVGLMPPLKAGGMVPELRAQRLLEIAARVKDQHCGDLRSALAGTLEKARLLLKQFPNIADPGADRILLFAGLAPVAAVPSNCPHVLVRIQKGLERENYAVNYREAQQVIECEIPESFEARQRAFLLLKHHGQTVCQRTKPRCAECPLREACAYAAGKQRGRTLYS